MSARRRSLVAVIAALVLGAGCGVAAAAPVSEPTPVEATGAAGDLVRAVAEKAG